MFFYSRNKYFGVPATFMDSLGIHLAKKPSYAATLQLLYDESQ